MVYAKTRDKKIKENNKRLLEFGFLKHQSKIGYSYCEQMNELFLNVKKGAFKKTS